MTKEEDLEKKNGEKAIFEKIKKIYGKEWDKIREEERTQAQKEILEIIEEIQNRIRIKSDARGDLEELTKRIKEII